MGVPQSLMGYGSSFDGSHVSKKMISLFLPSLSTIFYEIEGDVE